MMQSRYAHARAFNPCNHACPISSRGGVGLGGAGMGWDGRRSTEWARRGEAGRGGARQGGAGLGWACRDGAGLGRAARVLRQPYIYIRCAM